VETNVSDELDLVESLATAPSVCCAQCNGPLPALIEQLAVVHSRDGAMMMTCSIPCLAELVSALAGRPEQARQLVTGRQS
jgi:hypothetical protein